MKRFLIIGLIPAIILITTQYIFARKQDQNSNSSRARTQSDNSIYAVVGGQETGLTLFSNDDETRKIIQRSELQRKGDELAKIGLYEQAMAKFKASMAPALLNRERDIAGGVEGQVRIYQRQGRFEEALKEYQWFLDHHLPENEDVVQEKKLELKALIKSRDSGSPKPVYDHIAYLRKKYKKYIPPQSKGDSGFHSIPINTIIHLYNWMGDADGGIRFMEEVLSSREIYPAERAEYERVKQAFEEDKRTGQKGHLQKVIETSDYIGW